MFFLPHNEFSMVLDIVEGQGRGEAQKWQKFNVG